MNTKALHISTHAMLPESSVVTKSSAELYGIMMTIANRAVAMVRPYFTVALISISPTSFYL